MARSSRPSYLTKWKRALFGVGASALIAGSIVSGAASTAVAAPATFNPFDINNGFTVLAQGDVILNNGEIEGSVAAFGSASSGNQNGYAVIHNAAGEPGYTVPTIDGSPTRILADIFTGYGSFEVSNRDDSGSIGSTSPEMNAVTKFVNTSGLQGSDRSGFLRMTNTEGGNIDLKNVSFAGSDVSDYKTAESSIAAYFPDIESHVAQTNQCLAAMYNPELDLAHAVELNDQGGMVFPSGFAADRPNVINYADVAGKIIKMDNAGGYVPNADAPLVIRVAQGTTSIGQLNFEGWSPQAGAQQSLARYIMLDMSDVSGDVTIDGFALGAIWAPNASLHFNSGITTNGQWFAGGDITSAGGGEIHHHAFMGNLPCGEEPVVDPTEPTVDPTEPTVDPTEPTVDPTEPTEPTVEPTEPTEPTVDPSEPTVDPTEPTEPTEPTVDPTEPTEPTVDP
ncbi:collagen-binding domain-containing protein, partial [Arthrobacter sp. NIO-1057]|uniref:collagen-binding domain-containing protein n=1 Tax=Arthrobacter sp. NIO-1057 TaxID=993071 RepID=UPI00071C2038